LLGFSHLYLAAPTTHGTAVSGRESVCPGAEKFRNISRRCRFPCIFPANQGFAPETSLLQTAPSAIQSAVAETSHAHLDRA
jgi:hypothetical protein